MLGPSSTTRTIFDAIDCARGVLSPFEDLVRVVPSFVVVGMQSTGKSSVLRRISGIQFPQDSEVCTRVAMELSMRRCREDSESSVTILAKDKSWTGENHEEILREAQQYVLGDKEFVNDSYVKIQKQAPSCPEVTLIDLPGLFFARNNQATELETTVLELVKSRIASPMALICHVIPVNQDSDTINSWRVVGEADTKRERTIYILTKSDLVPTKEELQARLKKIVKDSDDSIAPDCFIVHGSALTQQQEEDALETVDGWVRELALPNVSIGITALNLHLEKVMLEHLRKCVPALRSQLQQEVISRKKELDAIGRFPRDPSVVVARGIGLVEHAIANECIKLRSLLREKMDALTKDIDQLTHEPKIDVSMLDQFNFAKLPQNFLQRDIDVRDKTNQEVSDFLSLLVEAREIMIQNKSITNEAFRGSLPILQNWNEGFLSRANERLVEFVNEVFDLAKKKFLQARQAVTSEAFQIAFESVGAAQLDIAFETVRDEALQVVANIRGWNHPEDLFTTSELFLKLEFPDIKANKEVWLALTNITQHFWKTSFSAVQNVCGYLNVQRLLMRDTISREVLRLLRKYVEQDVGEALSKCIEGMIQQTYEPRQLVRKRKLAIEREESATQAIKAIRLI